MLCPSPSGTPAPMPPGNVGRLLPAIPRCRPPWREQSTAAGCPHREPHARRPASRPCRNRGRQCRSEEHTSELQSRPHLVCRLLIEKKKNSLKPPPKLDNSNQR